MPHPRVDRDAPDAEGPTTSVPPRPEPDVEGRRVALAITAVVVVAAGLVSSRGDGVVADLAGGVLYTCLVYVLAALVRPRARARVLGAVALAVSVGVELLQLTPVPWLLAGVPGVGYVLGSTFVPWDLAAYAAGAALAATVDGVLRRPVSDPARRRG